MVPRISRDVDMVVIKRFASPAMSTVTASLVVRPGERLFFALGEEGRPRIPCNSSLTATERNADGVLGY